jgi:hypothetical protein
MLDFHHNAVLHIAPPSVLKLPGEWPAIKVLVTESLSSPVFPTSLPPQEAGWLLASSQNIASIQSFRPRAFPIESGTAGVTLATILATTRYTDKQCCHRTTLDQTIETGKRDSAILRERFVKKPGKGSSPSIFLPRALQ